MPLNRFITCVAEVVAALRSRDGVEDLADGARDGLDGAFGSLAEPVFDRSSTVPSRKKLKGRDNPRVDGGVALHVLDWQSVAGDRLHTGRQRDASGTQSQAGRGPGRGSQHESPAILLHLGLGQCIEIANDGGP
jgi:hypothetical protein